MWSRTCRHCEFSKKLIFNRTKPAKNTPLFLFPYMGHSLEILSKGCPLHAHVFSGNFSFTHNAMVLWLFRYVHPEKQTKFFSSSSSSFFFFFFDIYISWIQKKCRLHKTWSDHWNKAVHYNLSFSTASNSFVTFGGVARAFRWRSRRTKMRKKMRKVWGK